MPTRYIPYTLSASTTLLAHDHNTETSTTAYPDILPSAQEFTALSCGASQIFTRTARREELFMRMNRVSIIEQRCSSEELPDALTIANSSGRSQSHSGQPSIQNRSTVSLSDGQVSSSGLFLTPPSTPTALPPLVAKTGRPDTHRVADPSPTRLPRLPFQTYKYQPYRRTSHEVPAPLRPATQTESFDHLFIFAEPLNIPAPDSAPEESTSRSRPQHSQNFRSRCFSWEVDVPDDLMVKQLQ